jgi:hypothetical protein
MGRSPKTGRGVLAGSAPTAPAAGAAPAAPQSATGAFPPEAPDLKATFLRVGWFAILLGVGIEVLLVLVAAVTGTASGAAPFLADLVQKVSWSFIVCTGLNVGMAAFGARLPYAGLAGLLAAPVAFNVARALHKSATEALGMVAAAPIGPSVVVLSLLRGVEYGCLGVVLALLARRPWCGVAMHAAAGLAVGIVFGAAALALRAATAAAPLTGAGLLSFAVNEVLFPLGCALAIFAATALGRHVGDFGTPETAAERR